MSHLAVISTTVEPYKLVKEINGKYFEISGLNSLSDALRMKLSDLKKVYESSGSTELNGELKAPVALDTEIWGEIGRAHV